MTQEFSKSSNGYGYVGVCMGVCIRVFEYMYFFNTEIYLLDQ